MWENVARTLHGSLVALEPLEPRHEEGLWEAAQDERIWPWMPVRAAESRQSFHEWLESALAEAAAGRQVPFATLAAGDGRALGSTRYVELRPEHRRLEIGWTWVAPSAWGTGANVEAKLLMLEHAFERLGCLRVEFKTDARNERSRAALAALPARFEGVFRKHMVVASGSRDSAYYAVVDDEWPEVRAMLEARLAAKRA